MKNRKETAAGTNSNLLKELTYLGQYQSLSNILPYSSDRSARQYKKIRMHPMCWLGLNFIKLGLSAVPFVVECDENEEIKDIVEKMLKKIWPRLITEALECLDFGWKPFEIRWESGRLVYWKEMTDKEEEDKEEEDNNVDQGKERKSFDGLLLKSPKGLDAETIRILTEPKTGSLLGFEQDGVSEKILIEDRKALLFTHMLQSGQYYGISALEPAYPYWYDANLNRQFHMRWLERKGVGIMKGEYPIGVSKDGTDNQDVILDLLSGVIEGRVVSLPSTRDANGNRLWDIGLMSDEDKTDPFINRAKYLDDLILRALIIPEKALTQGEVGARASIEAFQNMFLQRKEELLDSIVDVINNYLVPHFVELNFGKDIDVQVSSGDLSDNSKEVAGELVGKLIDKDKLKVNTQWLIDKTSIPLEEIEEEEEEEIDADIDESMGDEEMAAENGGEVLDEEAEKIGKPKTKEEQKEIDEKAKNMSETGRWRALNKLENRFQLSDVSSFLTERSARFQMDIKEEMVFQQERIINYLKKNYTADAKFVSIVSEIEIKRAPIKKVFKEFLNDVYSYSYNKAKSGVEKFIGMASADTSNQFIGFRIDTIAEKLANEYESALKYQLSSDLGSQLSEKEIVDRLKAMSEDFLSGYRLANIAETEIGFTLGKAFEDYLRDNKYLILKGLISPGKEIQRVMASAIMDDAVCPICEKLDGTVVPVDSAIRAKYDYPLHYHCRCLWIPITKEDIEDPDIAGTDLSMGSKGKPITLDEIVSMVGVDSKYKLFSDHKHKY